VDGGENLGASDTGAGVCLLAISGVPGMGSGFSFLLGLGLELWILRDSCLYEFNFLHSKFLLNLRRMILTTSNGRNHGCNLGD
jgi:hypothetical protein